ncbi:VOC family protein [Jatrophihabitans sp.]|uniref:VOC family protein n=1 Tax=Jatrophihabitans sp. TaxID=1932789 RepID=UPI0030C741D4|nr:Glyoxalase/bleomycin resistance protein/dioxygenase [Jatrophihabitans sp.]
MIAVDSLNHVALTVSDIDSSLRFFVDGLGLRRTLTKPVGAATWLMLGLPEETGGQSVFVQGSQRVGQIELVQWDRPPYPERGVAPGQVGHVVLSFPIPREYIGELHERLAGLGFPCTELRETVIVNYGPVAVFVATGPDGYQAEVISLPSRNEVKAFRDAVAGAAADG